MNERLMKFLGGAAVALPSLAWAGLEVHSAVRKAGEMDVKVPVLERRLDNLERADDRVYNELQQVRQTIVELAMLEYRDRGNYARVRELEVELKKLKEVAR